MRISDWSSDVCSSDLEGYARNLLGAGANAARDKRLKALVDKKITEDKATLAVGEKAAQKQANGDALVATGFNLVTYGQTDHGLKLMQDGKIGRAACRESVCQYV